MIHWVAVAFPAQERCPLHAEPLCRYRLDNAEQKPLVFREFSIGCYSNHNHIVPTPFHFSNHIHVFNPLIFSLNLNSVDNCHVVIQLRYVKIDAMTLLLGG